jgi:hypothetical protein
VRYQDQHGETRPELFEPKPAPSADDIAAAAVRLRKSIEHDLPAQRMAANLAGASKTLRSDSVTIRAIAEHLGWSDESLGFSIAAMLDPVVKPGDLDAFARSFRPVGMVIGFVAAGNIPGVGLHEVIAALLAGCAVMVKTATAEPFFFAGLAAALREIDSQLGARIAVFNWQRERDDLTAAMRASCDAFVAFGDDGTIARLQSPVESSIAAPFAGFGARVSGIALTSGALDEIAISEAAKDVARFEQRGCLSPHHIFVEDPDNARAVHIAARFAEELQRISQSMPPPSRLSLEDAAAIRRAREIARWRSIGDHHVRLWESAHLDWTVIYDRDATFAGSPGYRTVFVSPFADLSDLKRRLDPVGGRIEAFALAAKSKRGRIEPLLRDCGATYICEPGRMQSPPLDWPHGGGAFLRLLRDDK